MFLFFVTKFDVSLIISFESAAEHEKVGHVAQLAKFTASLFDLVIFRGLGFFALLKHLE